MILPQVEFKDWETVVDVRPGGRHTVRDQTRHFNEILYRLEYLASFELKAELGKTAALEAELSDTWGSWELDVTVRRTDVYQGLHREKR